MRRWFVPSIIALAALAVGWFGVAPGAAQGSAAASYTPPRTPDGHPDLQGTWQALNTAAWDIEDYNARLGVPAGRGVVEGGPLPYQPWALARKQENARNRAALDLEGKCHLLGVPRMTYMPYPFRIVQQRDKITILYEYLGAVRFLYMNGNPHPKGPIEWFMGGLARALGRQHPGCRRRALHRTDLVRPSGQLP